ncbi:RNA-dependent RNA polymerase, partial [Lecanoromycetidae sp. Uapishka_2]
MEVIVRNLPDQITEKQVDAYFRKVLNKLGIKTFQTQKLRSRGCATITILDLGRARQFMMVHGQTQPGAKGFASVQQKLFHMNRSLNCTQSNKIPDEYLLKALKKEESDRYARQIRKATIVPGKLENSNPAKLTETQQAPKFYESLDTNMASPNGNDLTNMLQNMSLRRSSQNYTRKRISALRVQALKSFPAIPDSISWTTSTITKQSFAAQMTSLNSFLAGAKYSNLPFEIKFQIQRLAQNGILSPSRTSKILTVVARQLTLRSNVKIVARSIRSLCEQLPFAGPDTEASDLSLSTISEMLSQNQEFIEREESYSKGLAEQHEHIADVHKAMVTPTGIYLHGPEPEVKNRVLRKYSAYPNHFLSVSFMDEEGESLRFDRQTSGEEIYHDRFKKVLEGVINIAGRGYEFLGFSHSSLRSQTCWFMAPFTINGSLVYARSVIRDLGDFSLIRSPAKCAARIGQAFSQTFSSVAIPPEAFRIMQDVERNGRTFSDGVGTCSLDILHQIWGVYSQARGLKPTALQIRFQGQLITGNVVITRSPALHPGDVQCVTAVDVPADSPLRALHNVVVFSSKGSRDLPSQLSGGDLDGDLYNIIYDINLYPKRLAHPADYLTSNPIDIGRTVERSDMTDFFIKFMENDNLGLIATLHQILADQYDIGTFHPECVDFKQLPKYPKFRPDFQAPGPRVLIEKEINFEDEEEPSTSDGNKELDEVASYGQQKVRYYESQKVLGKLYREIDEFEILKAIQEHSLPAIPGRNAARSLSDAVWNYVNERTALIIWEHHNDFARDVKEGYDVLPFICTWLISPQLRRQSGTYHA